MVPALTPRVKAAAGAAPRRVHLLLERHGDRALDPGHDRQGRRLSDHPQAVRAAPLVGGRRQRARQQGRGHASHGLVRLADRCVGQAHRGRRRLQQHLDRPGDRRQGRRRDAAAVARGRHRGLLERDWIVRRRLQLHLRQHDLVAHADDAAADGDQPARGVRADVRAGRHAGPARGAAAPAEERPRRRRPRDRPAPGPRRHRRQAPAERVPAARPRGRRADPEGREAERGSTRTRRRPRSASPSRTTTT